MTELLYQLITQCAPTLLKCKTANLFSCKKNMHLAVCNEIEHYNKQLNTKGIYIKQLFACKNRTFYILYRLDKMEEYLSNANVKKCLNQIGYPISQTTIEMLNHLEKRMAKYQDFPHEIGFFLGYPPEDVFSFIETNGADYKLCGYWKVYNNEEKAKKIFKQYQQCKNVMTRRVSTGEALLKMLGAA